MGSPASTDIEELFSSLLGKHDKLGVRLRHVDFDVSTSGKRIKIRGSYPAFRDGVPQLDELLAAVHHRIVPFCLPRKQIKKVYEEAKLQEPGEAAVAYTSLIKKATDLFIRAKKGDTRSGEAGEILLFLLNEWVLQAPQLVSKMYLKTNNNMPVHGTDGIHGKYSTMDETLHLYWGESKAYSNLPGALAAALKSISEFYTKNQQQREIEIVSEYLDLGDAQAEEREAIVAFLDPYNEQSNARKTYFSCLLVFAFSNPKDPNLDDDDLEMKFVAQFKDEAEKFLESLPDHVKRADLQNVNFEFFLLPVESAEKFRDKFQALIGWPNA